MDQAARTRQYWKIKESLTKQERELINYYEILWHLRHTVPTIEQVATYLKLTQVTVNYYLQRRPVIKALDNRGIPWRQHSQSELTATQVAAAITMANFADERPAKVKLDQLGINPATYYAWLNDPQFSNMVKNLADENIKNIDPVAKIELAKKIQAGEWNAVKYYLDVTGAIKNEAAPQTEQMLMMFVEIIQKHVKDPVLMVAIAQDLKLAAANKTLEVAVHPQIIGEVVDDISEEELEELKHKMGIQ